MTSSVQPTQPTRLASQCQQRIIVEERIFRLAYFQQQYLHRYIPPLTQTILKGAEKLKGRCLVLNPVDHDGLPLAALCKQFDKVTLAAPLLRLHNHIQICSPLPDLHPLDFTGGNLPALSRACESSSAKNLPSLLDDFSLSTPSAFGSYDFIVSHRVEYWLSEFFNTYISELLRRNDPDHHSAPFIYDSVASLTNRLAVQHIRFLHQLLSPSGRILYCEPTHQTRTLFKKYSQISLLSSAEAERTRNDLFNSITIISQWSYQKTPYCLTSHIGGKPNFFVPATHETTTAYLLSQPT